MRIFQKSIFSIVVFFFFFQSPLALFADKSFELTQACRNNLKIMRDGLTSYLNKESKEIPKWDTFDHIYTMLLTAKYIPHKPVPPTLDCKYFLIFKTPELFDWYCAIHGVISGDKSITFRYHEYEFKGVINTKYIDVPQYKSHTDELSRWVGYSPTLIETVKFNFEKNPSTTILKVVFGVVVVFYIYKKIFGP